jgi:hypothetical protein
MTIGSLIQDDIAENAESLDNTNGKASPADPTETKLQSSDVQHVALVDMGFDDAYNTPTPDESQQLDPRASNGIWHSIQSYFNELFSKDDRSDNESAATIEVMQDSDSENGEEEESEEEVVG